MAKIKKVKRKEACALSTPEQHNEVERTKDMERGTLGKGIC